MGAVLSSVLNVMLRWHQHILVDHYSHHYSICLTALLAMIHNHPFIYCALLTALLTSRNFWRLKIHVISSASGYRGIPRMENDLSLPFYQSLNRDLRERGD